MADWWYALVSASPRPESGEAVNIGLIVGNGGPVQLEYLRKLPRLKSLVTPEELAVYGEVLDGLERRIQTGAELSTLRSLAGPQVRISEPRALYRRPDKATLATLRRQFIDVPGRLEGLRAAGEQRSATEELLDSLLIPVIPLGLRPERRMSAEHLYPDLPGDLTQVRIPNVARAVRSEQRDLLIDGAVIEPTKLDVSIKNATGRVARAFWYYGRLRDSIRRYARRDVQTVGVLFNGKASESQDVADAEAFIRHVWELDADLVVQADRSEDIDKLRSRLAWTLGT